MYLICVSTDCLGVNFNAEVLLNNLGPEQHLGQKKKNA